jgi:hypothetical protein
MTVPPPARTRHATYLLIACVSLLYTSALQAQQKSSSRKDPPPSMVFSENDAVTLLDHLSQALESNNQRAFLKVFNAATMPAYPAFRDQVSDFFANHESFRVHYHLTQISTRGQLGMILAEFQLEAVGPGNSIPVRRDVQLRLVTALDGKRWKIVDVAPRSLFQ